MKKFTVVFYLVWLLIISVLQPTVMGWIEIFGITPDMFLIFVVCAGLLRGMWDGAICGFVFGLVLDLIIGRMIGLNAALYMYAGLITGVLKDKYINSDSAVTNGVFVLGSTLVCGLLHFIAYNMAWDNIGFFMALIRIIIPKAIYTAAISFILYVPMKKSFDLIKERRMF